MVPKAVLEKKIVQMEEVAAAATKDSEKKDESPASPKQIDEGDVSNETPQVNTYKKIFLNRSAQNLHWKFGRLAPSFGIILARYLETTAKEIFF